MFLDCVANLILPISCHGIIFGTHMEALGMMGEGFSLPIPPYHQPSWRIWLSGPVLLIFHPLPRYINVPGLCGQPNIANILSWHYLWDPYGGFGHDGRSIQPAIPSLPSAILKNLAVWGQFFSSFHPLPRYINVPGLCGQPNIANILSWHYLWDPYGGFGHDGRRIQPANPSLPSAILKNLAVWEALGNFQLANPFHPLPRYINVPGLCGQPNIANILSWHYLWDPYGGFGWAWWDKDSACQSLLTISHLEEFGCLGQFYQ